MTAQEHKLSLLYAGIRPQEDRDARFAVKAARQEKKLWNMIRVRIPLGALSPEQYLALDELAERVTYNRSLRVTVGQSIQLHGVQDSALESTIAEVERVGLAAGCHRAGFEFAVAVPPAPLQTNAYRKLREVAGKICGTFYPHPGRGESAHPDHPPRKFTIGLGLSEDNSVNIFAQDVGLLLMPLSENEWKMNVFAGGSLSMPAKRPYLYPRLATPLASVPLDQVIPAINAITSVFARHGELSTRRYTRLKYVVDELGPNRFRSAVERELGSPLTPPTPSGELQVPDSLGARDQGNGLFFYGLNVPFGRIQDAGIQRYRSAVRMIVEALRPNVILAPDQNIIFANLRQDQIAALEKILVAYHIPFGQEMTRLRFSAMACSGIPTCPLAVAESERVAGSILDELQKELSRIGRKEYAFNFRISGCSIGCIRPNMVDLGAIGRKPGHYDLFVGGSETRVRFGELYAENVPLAEIVSTVRPLLESWGEHGEPEESFSDFYSRWFAD